ncbi:MAG: hypothetical protein M1392_04300 [Gammaproteobacteria bacterium]|nr:hypothetical protein [Gammaproteobacteria bacterium]
MMTRFFIHFLLVLSLALGPAVSALAEGWAGHGSDAQYTAGQPGHDMADCGQVAGHHHVDMDKDQGTGHDPAQGHNHSACGAHCLAGLLSSPSVIKIDSVVQHFVLSVPVTGIVVSTALRPPQTLPG